MAASRKLYILIAEELRFAQPKGVSEDFQKGVVAATEAIMSALKKDNSSFDKSKFVSYIEKGK